MRNHRTLLLGLATAGTLSAGGVLAATVVSQEAPIDRQGGTPPQPSQAPPASTPAPGSSASRPTAREARDILRPDFAIFRREADAGAPNETARTLRASNGRRLVAYLDGHGVCLQSDGGSGCGDPRTAASVASVSHAVDPQGVESLAGLVPDDVAAVRVRTTTGRSEDVAARDNVFYLRLAPGEQSSEVLWVMSDGSVQRKVP
jgi:hypothetical protein